MKKLLSLIAISGIAMQLTSCGGNNGGGYASLNRLERIIQDGYIIMATSPDFAPFIFMDYNLSGQEAIVGADAALGRFIADELGVELYIQSMDFAASLAAVTTGLADITIGGMSWTQERSYAMMLSTSYRVEGDGFQGLLTLAEVADNFNYAEDFAGLLVGAQNGTLQQTYTQSQLPDAQIQLVSTVTDGILMLLTGQIDALAMSGDVAEMYILNYPELALVNFTFEQTAAGHVLGMPNGSYELFERIEEIIDIVIQNNLYEQWLFEAEELSRNLAID